MKQNKRKTGTEYENIAADYLRQKGYEILEHSFRCRMGEIDLIAVDPGNDTHGQNPDSDRFPENGCLVFIEVKYRVSRRSGLPEEAVTFSKQRTICRVADYYRVIRGIDEALPCRFDVIAIEGTEIRHYRNAFSYIV
ncbi:MAG: YraN family protein [Eubacteriales bacterium]|jgi:putative endonuclease